MTAAPRGRFDNDLMDSRPLCTASGPVGNRRASLLGFTLVELLIALAVAGILVAIALPAFNDSIRKSRRAEAFAALNAVQLAQERWRANRPTYAANLTAAPTADPPGLGLPATTSGGRYAVALGNVGATTFTATATAVSGSSQADDGSCARLRMRVERANVVYGSAPLTGDTWDESATNRCWAR
jgi:type IV pilus assembly protein PilE